MSNVDIWSEKENPWLQKFEYKSGSNNVTITPADIHKMIASGYVKPSFEETMVFIHTCKDLGLNPFLKDAYLMKYSDREPATIVVGKNAFMKRAESHAMYKGFQAGLIVEDSEGSVDYKEGSFVSKSLKVLGGWCKVYREDRTNPFLVEVDIEEYIGKKKNGEVNQQWSTKQKTMIRKVAIVQCLREAFPQELSAMYVEEEFQKPEHIPTSHEEIKEEINQDHEKWSIAIEHYKNNNNFDLIEKHYNISDENKALIMEMSKDA